jgi:hypothetical protein
MSVKIQRVIGLVVLLMTGAVQAEVVGLNTFASEYVGSNVTVTLSQATTNGFKINYDTIASGNSLAIAAAGLSGGPRMLAVGDSAVLSFKYNTTKVSTLDLGFRWGIDFGDTVLQMRADTASASGASSTTFLQETYIVANGSTTNMTAASGTYANFDVAGAPTSNYWFKTGNSNIAVTTTVTRVAANTYTIDVVWGGNTYSSTNTGFSADGTIDSVFFGNGKDSGGGVAANDNFTVSDVTLEASPVSEFLLTVNSGTGGGWYTNGQQVAIVPDTLFLQTFAAWTGHTQYLGSAVSVASNTVIMPANPVTLTATYLATAHYTTLGLETFSNEYVGTYSVTLSGAATNGFTETYTATNTGNTFVMASAGVSGGPFTLEVGKSAVLTYRFTGGRVATLDLAWRWGFDFGDTAIQMRADTCSSGGVNGGDFLNMGFVTANGALTNASSGTLKNDWVVGSDPASNYWFKTGNNNVAVQTTVTRNSTTNYTISVLWGGLTYAYTTNAPTLDGTIDSVYFGYGRSVSGGVAVGDNYTISDVSLSVTSKPVIGPVKSLSLICIY